MGTRRLRGKISLPKAMVGPLTSRDQVNIDHALPSFFGDTIPVFSDGLLDLWPS
jgi:hypothetical protein